MRTYNHSCNRRGAITSGFTLVEALVSVAIIIVLAALVFVALRGAKRSAMQAKALGPLREVTTANMAFAQEYNGRINTLRWVGDPEEGRPFVENSFWGRMGPHLFVDLEGGSQQEIRKQIRQRLNGILETSNADTMEGTLLQGSKIYHDGSGLPIPFAFNDHLYTWKNWETVHRAGGLSEIIYITYGFGIFNEADGKTYAERPTDGSKPDNNIYYLPSQKAMVAFLDGHVEYLAPPIPERKFRPDDR